MKKSEYRGTCSVCGLLHCIIGESAVVSHGYMRPGGYWKTADCAGAGYPAFEISTEGLIAALTWLRDSVKLRTLRLQDLKDGKVSSLTVRIGSMRTQVVNRDDPNWELMLQGEIYASEQSLQKDNDFIANGEARLESWKPGKLFPVSTEPPKKVCRLEWQDAGAEWKAISPEGRTIAKGRRLHKVLPILNAKGWTVDHVPEEARTIDMFRRMAAKGGSRGKKAAALVAAFEQLLPAEQEAFNTIKVMYLMDLINYEPVLSLEAALAKFRELLTGPHRDRH